MADERVEYGVAVWWYAGMVVWGDEGMAVSRDMKAGRWIG